LCQSRRSVTCGLGIKYVLGSSVSSLATPLLHPLQTNQLRFNATNPLHRRVFTLLGMLWFRKLYLAFSELVARDQGVKVSGLISSLLEVQDQVKDDVVAKLWALPALPPALAPSFVPYLRHCYRPTYRIERGNV
jgi:hypothetical protein